MDRTDTESSDLFGSLILSSFSLVRMCEHLGSSFSLVSSYVVFFNCDERGFCKWGKRRGEIGHKWVEDVMK